MDWLNFVLGIVTLILAGVNIWQFIFLKQTKKKYTADADKAKAEAKSSEIDNLQKQIESVYNPMIKAQNERIALQDEKISARDRQISDLEAKVRTLLDEKHQQELAYQRQIADLQKQITEITRALGIKAAKQLRNGRGQFTTEKEAK